MLNFCWNLQQALNDQGPDYFAVQLIQKGTNIANLWGYKLHRTAADQLMHQLRNDYSQRKKRAMKRLCINTNDQTISLPTQHSNQFHIQKYLLEAVLLCGEELYIRGTNYSVDIVKSFSPLTSIFLLSTEVLLENRRHIWIQRKRGVFDRPREEMTTDGGETTRDIYRSFQISVTAKRDYPNWVTSRSVQRKIKY